MRLLRKPTLSKKVSTKKEPEKKEKKVNKLPPDTYKDEIEPKEMVIDENKKLIISVKRGGEFGLPMVDVRIYATTETYTGFTKKGITLPISDLVDLIDLLSDVQDRCDEKGLLEESEEE